MGLRPGHCYRNEGLRHDRPYTRLAVTVQRKNYIGAAPGLRTRQFNMGNPVKQYSKILDLVAGGTVQVRDNAIESTRLIINRFLVRRVGKDNYFMRIRVYPHHVLRENKQAQGAHADRIQTGMSNPFGKPIGRAARVHAGTVLMSVLVNDEHVALAEEALKRARARIPCKVAVKVHDDVKSIGTLPKRVREEAVEEKPKEEAAEGEKAEGAAKAEGKEAEKKAEGKAGAKAEGKGESAGKGKADAAGAKAGEKKDEKKK